MGDELDDLRKKSRESAAKADQLLEHELESLKGATSIDLESLRPKLSLDAESFDQLVEAVQQATQRNESIAELKHRLEKLGSTVVAVAKKASTLLAIPLGG